MTGFDHFSSDARQFLLALKVNNSRDWFAANRKTYEAEIKEPTRHFAAAMSAALSEHTGQLHDAKLYRINRDIRFSKDKTPYNAHVHLSFFPEGIEGIVPMWHFGFAPDKLSLGCGVFQFDKEGLARFRTAMDGPEGKALIGMTEKMRQDGIRIAAPELKRVPTGFAKDHPHAEALRRKGFVGWRDQDDPDFTTQPDLVGRTLGVFRELSPIYDLLMTLN